MKLNRVLSVSLAMGLLTVGLFSTLPARAEERVVAAGVASIDLPESHAKQVSLEIIDGSFNYYNAGKIRVEANAIDFRNGSLGGLHVNVAKGDFDNIWVDQMNIQTAAFNFDTFELLNHRRFVFAQPINGSVNLTISEDSLNHFLQHPKTLERLEKAVAKKTGGMKVMTFSNPQLKMLKDNQIQLDVLTTVGGGIQVPVQMLGKLAILNNNLAFSNLKVVSQNNEVPLPLDVTKPMEKQLNDLINLEKLGKQTFVIRANSLKMKKGVIDIAGDATFTKLEFGTKTASNK